MFGEDDVNQKVYDAVVKTNAREVQEVEDALKAFSKKSLQRLVLTAVGIKEFKLNDAEERILMKMVKVQESIFGAIALHQHNKGE